MKDFYMSKKEKFVFRKRIKLRYDRGSKEKKPNHRGVLQGLLIFQTSGNPLLGIMVITLLEPDLFRKRN